MAKPSTWMRAVPAAASLLLMGAAAPKGCQQFSFSPVSAPATDAEMRAIRATDAVTIGAKTVPIGYTTILRSGQTVGSDTTTVFGQLLDDQGLPLLRADGSKPIADSNDFSSLLPVGNKLFSVAQFESQPGAMYLTELDQADDGKLTAKKLRPIDLTSIHGLWNPCAGMVTPWGTHLGSEEYEPDAKSGATLAAGMAPYFGGGTVLGGDATKVNPYFYGFPVEVTVKNSHGGVSVAKHYSMGRFAHELSYVLPDQKTVYQADDGTNVGFYMYVADRPGKLDEGTLYAMKWHQTSAPSASSLATADVSFVELGHACDSEIEEIAASGITFADIFDTATPASDGTCPSGFKAVNANGVGLECLAVKSGKEKAAAFLESRRYAGYLGATTELRKEEGITFDPAKRRLYVAYSEIQYGMEDAAKNGTPNTNYDKGLSNDIKVLFNACGGVYAYDLGPDAAIGSGYVAKKATGIIAGRMTTKVDPSKLNSTTIDAYADTSPFAGSSCDIDGLANPDNLSFMEDQGILLIGEDTGDGHRNDAVWAYDVEGGDLTRIATTPYGAETTSLYNYADIGGFGYIVMVAQHPYGESDQSKLTDPADAHSYFGYIGPIPTKLRR